jgi:hypothetical protein
MVIIPGGQRQNRLPPEQKVSVAGVPVNEICGIVAEIVKAPILFSGRSFFSVLLRKYINHGAHRHETDECGGKNCNEHSKGHLLSLREPRIYYCHKNVKII